MTFIFICYYQVAEILINPFGDDDDDFDCNHIVDSNYERSRAIVMAQEEEEEGKEEEEDDAEMPECLPHTVESYRHQEVFLLLCFCFKNSFAAVTGLPLRACKIENPSSLIWKA